MSLVFPMPREFIGWVPISEPKPSHRWVFLGYQKVLAAKKRETNRTGTIPITSLPEHVESVGGRPYGVLTKAFHVDAAVDVLAPRGRGVSNLGTVWTF